MDDVAIRVENLSKAYRLVGTREEYDTLRDKLVEGVRSLASRWRTRRPPDQPRDRFWALRDVSLQVKHGEVLGIVGRNGAGKSTLLKVLSRITAPTRGRVVLMGRVGSLLEVGTGFHPELTGRENIYLNGAILGMGRREIERKFDEIIAFSEIEKFLDTPVKHYSSGMYVRLAFAVAAHLEPEILLVDEVLAVGDAAFQRKCLSKMGSAAKEGRTVVFVSHNLQAVQSLCTAAVQIDAGRIVSIGDPRSVVVDYLSNSAGMRGEITWPLASAPGDDDLRLTGVWVRSTAGNASGVYSTRDDLCVDLEFDAASTHEDLCVGFDLMTNEGTVILRSYQTDAAPESWPPVHVGRNRWYCTIPAGLLNGGVYYVCPRISLHNRRWIVQIDSVIQFELVLDHGVSPLWNSLTGHSRPGVISPILRWSVAAEADEGQREFAASISPDGAQWQA